jgi:hypothetical protein
MPKFKIQYYFDSKGIMEIEAKTETEARKKFYNGDTGTSKIIEEWGEDFFIESVEKL